MASFRLLEFPGLSVTVYIESLFQSASCTTKSAQSIDPVPLKGVLSPHDPLLHTLMSFASSTHIASRDSNIPPERSKNSTHPLSTMPFLPVTCTVLPTVRMLTSKYAP